MKVALVIAVSIAFCSCSKLFPVDVGEGQAQGTVLRVDTVHNQVTLDHKEIPNLIEAMTFSYPVKDRALLRNIHPLDTVLFTLKETAPGSFEIEAIRPVK